MTKWMAALVCALEITAGFAAENNSNTPPLTLPTKSLGGVWTGSLGKMDVTVCFNGSNNHANYYYQKYLIPIRMYADEVAVADGVAKRWVEPNGNWIITGLSENEMHGSWSSKDRSRSLPIYLKRITPKTTEQRYDPINQACGTDDFNLPLEYPRKPVFGSVQKINHVRFRDVTVSLDKTSGESDYRVTSIEVLGSDSGAKTLNEFLRKLLPVDDEMIGFMYGIRRETLAMGTEGKYSRDASATIMGHLLLLQVTEVTNGSYRPVVMTEYKYIYDVRTGQPENWLAWFKGGENMKIESPTHLPPSLAEFVYSKIGIGDPRSHLSKEEFVGCYGYDTPGKAKYDLGLLDGKMNFFVSVARSGACGETIEIPFAELKPYLNKKGKAELAEIATSSPKNK